MRWKRSGGVRRPCCADSYGRAARGDVDRSLVSL